MGHESLKSYFKSNFSLMQFHKWSIGEIEAMIPWEYYIYLDMLKSYLQEEERKFQEEMSKQRARNGGRR